MEPLDGPVSLPSALVTPSPDTMLDMDAFNLPTPDSSDLLAIQPQSSAAKPPKKRKSWGQPLPEPTTSLGPRKRAKTADEKEQRRIERIKRNRAAAHNSRERKRQEAAQLEIENGRLKQQMAILHAALAKCREYVPAALLPQLTADAFAAAQVSFQQDIKEESLVDTPASYATIDPRASLTASTPNESTSPPYIKAEAASPSPMTAPSASAATFTSELPLDQTRHSAAMLCDLQCRSSESTLEDKAASWRWAQLILSFLDAVAESHGADDGPIDLDFDAFISDNHQYTTNYNDSTNDQHFQFDDNDASTTSQGFNLDDTFLTPDLALSGPQLADYSAFTCDVS
ncbi:hypothetical protein MBLNU459_g3857t1 [Dothideomycetes sp. NU459]